MRTKEAPGGGGRGEGGGGGGEQLKIRSNICIKPCIHVTSEGLGSNSQFPKNNTHRSGNIGY